MYIRFEFFAEDVRWGSNIIFPPWVCSFLNATFI